MCPPLLFLRKPRGFYRNHSARRAEWAASSRCVTAIYFEDNDSRAIVCTECHADSSKDERKHYTIVVKHYINFGIGPLTLSRLEDCSICHVLVVEVHDISECNACSLQKIDFLGQLLQSGEEPWWDSLPTVFCHSLRRGASSLAIPLPLPPTH